MKEQVIRIQIHAPAKPLPGEPCNGCGICCLLETCPAGRIRFLQISGACPALIWRPSDSRYVCGLLQTPGIFFRWLPKRWESAARCLMRHWIATDIGCDCTAVAVETAPESTLLADESRHQITAIQGPGLGKDLLNVTTHRPE